MKLGLCSIAMLDRPLDDVAESAAAAGLSFLEITARPPHTDGDPSMAVIAHRLEPLAYGSYLGLHESDAPRAVEAARACGASILRVWAQERDAVGLIRRTCDLAPDLTIVIERHTRSLADTAEQCEELLQAIDRPNAGLNWQPLDFMPLADAKGVPDDAERLAPLARYVHAKNYRAGDDRCEPWGSLRDGVLDWRSIVVALRDGGYEGAIAIEFLGGALNDEAAFLQEICA